VRIITITCKPDGTTTVETDGYAGAECQGATAALEAALGARAGDRPKAEMYAEPEPDIDAGRTLRPGQ
jgi:hypothetical protein